MTDVPLEPLAAAEPRLPTHGAPLHPISRRVMHWLNAIAIVVMIGSGWRIYDEYPELPLNFGFPPIATLGGDYLKAWARSNDYGEANAIAWHLAGMWLLVLNYIAYLVVGFASGHFRRDFLPIQPKAVLRDMADALRGRLDHDLGHYNAVQKLLYTGVLGAILITILSGFSIWKPVQLQSLVWLFGGFDTARVVHCLGMLAIVGFLVVHVLLAILVPKTIVEMTVGRVFSTRAKK
jgi:thiosulfate reductase cytochrome b subunit